MNPGKLRHRVTVQRPTQSKNAAGGVTVTYADECKRWAFVKPMTGREIMRAQQTIALMPYDVELNRAVPGMTPDWRFVWDGKNLNVKNIADVSGDGTHIVCSCVEVIT